MSKRKEMNERICCADGYNVSVQAREGSYCTPRDDQGPYSAVELGYPSAPDPLLDGYAENSNRLLDTVYGYVPVGVVRDLIVKHGGAVSGEAPDGVLVLWATGQHPTQTKGGGK